MKITLENFADFINGEWDWDEKTATNTGLFIYPKDPKNRDIGGGKLTKEDIDELKNHPQTDTLSIMGLHQDTFEYFIKTYGKQLKAIRFLKIKWFRIGLCWGHCPIWNLCISFIISGLRIFGI